MNLLDQLDDLHGKATPGDWRVKDIPIPYDHGKRTLHQRHIETAYDHPQLRGPVGVVAPSTTAADDERYRYGVWLSVDDAATIVALHNAWPAISRALRAAQAAADNYGAYGLEQQSIDELQKALEGLVKP